MLVENVIHLNYFLRIWINNLNAPSLLLTWIQPSFWLNRRGWVHLIGIGWCLLSTCKVLVLLQMQPHPRVRGTDRYDFWMLQSKQQPASNEVQAFRNLYIRLCLVRLLWSPLWFVEGSLLLFHRLLRCSDLLRWSLFSFLWRHR